MRTYARFLINKLIIFLITIIFSFYYARRISTTAVKHVGVSSLDCWFRCCAFFAQCGSWMTIKNNNKTSPTDKTEGEGKLQTLGDSKNFSENIGSEEVLKEIECGHGAAEQELGKGRQRLRASFSQFCTEERYFYNKTSEAAEGQISHKKRKKQNLKAKCNEIQKQRKLEKAEEKNEGSTNPEEGRRRGSSSYDEKMDGVIAQACGGEHKSRQKNAFVRAVKEALSHLEEEINCAALYRHDLPSSLENHSTAHTPSSFFSAASTTAATSPMQCRNAVRCIADLYPRKFERHGHVVVITKLEDGVSLERDFTPTIAACFAQSFTVHKKAHYSKKVTQEKGEERHEEVERHLLSRSPNHPTHEAEDEEKKRACDALSKNDVSPSTFLSSMNMPVDVVLYDPVGISGELRQPSLQLLYSDPTSCHTFPLVEAPMMLEKRWTRDALRAIHDDKNEEDEEEGRKSNVSTTLDANALEPVLPEDTVKGDGAGATAKKEVIVKQNPKNMCVPSLSALRFLIERYVSSSITSTIHVENKIIYGMDANRVMFSSGNTTERMHFSRVEAKGEEVVDMFCGIGYFSLPLAVHGGPRIIHAVDMNPDSVAFLRLNAVWNHVGHVLDPRCGDNREVGDDWIGQCDRVLMGYLPSCKEHLGRAVMFLKASPIHSSRWDRKVRNNGRGRIAKVEGKKGARGSPSSHRIFTRPQGIIHYHFLAEAHNAEDILWEHFSEEIGAEFLTNSEDDEDAQEEENELDREECSGLPEVREVQVINGEVVPTAVIPSPTRLDHEKEGTSTATLNHRTIPTSRTVNRFEVLDLRRVKSYSPKVYHYVADVKFS